MTILKQPNQFTPPLRIIFCFVVVVVKWIMAHNAHCKESKWKCPIQSMIIIVRNEAIPVDRSSHTHEVGDQQTSSWFHFNLWFIRIVVARNANENKRESHFNSRSIGSDFCVMRNGKLHELKNYVATSLFNRFHFFFFSSPFYVTYIFKMKY